MKILFVKSNKFGSRLIRWGLGEDCSHVAVWFESLKKALHSYGAGITELSEEDFFKINTIVHQIPVSIPSEEIFYYAFKAATAKIPYDYSALCYFAYRGCLKKFFNVPFPKENALDKRSKFLCTEAIYAFLDIYSLETHHTILVNSVLSITSPYQLYLYLKTVL
jgi:hypothetical protein